MGAVRGRMGIHVALREEAALQSAARRGDEEATWLLQMREKNSSSEFDESPRGRYYSGLSLGGRLMADEAFMQIQLAALHRFPRAMSAFGEQCILHGNVKDGLEFLADAVAVDDAEGVALWAVHAPGIGESERRALRERAAAMGSLLGLSECVRWASSRVERAILSARNVVMSGNTLWEAHEVEAAVELLSEEFPMDAQDARVLFLAGRELEGYEQLWREDAIEKPTRSQRACIGVYLTVTHRARQAALQAVVGLRAAGLHRDVALDIAKRVYATREDAYSWFVEMNV